MSIHIAIEVPGTSGPPRHGIEFHRENGFIVDQIVTYNPVIFFIPGPSMRISQWRFPIFGGQVFFHLRQFDRIVFGIDHIRHIIFVIHRERFSPVALTREYRIAQTVIDFSFSDTFFLHHFDDLVNRLFGR